MIQISFHTLIELVFLVVFLIGLFELSSIKRDLEVLKRYVKDNDNEYRKKLGLPPSSPYFWS